jgi:hypothetical protein
MCSVCCAGEALAGPRTFTWRDGPDGGGLEVEARGTHPELPATFRFRRRTDNDDAPWSPWLTTPDLAGAMMRLGVDVRWKYVHATVRAYVEGKKSIITALRALNFNVAAAQDVA